MNETSATRQAEAPRVHRARWLPWALAGLSFALVGLFAWLEVRHHRALGTRELWFDGAISLFGLAFPAVGALLADRKPGNPIGWIMLTIGISFAASSVAHAYSQWAPMLGPGAPTAVQWVAWVGTWSWAPGWSLMLTFLLLLFPDGHLPSPRWRWAAWVSAVAIAFETVGSMMDPNPTGDALYRNPLGIRSVHSVAANIGGFQELAGTGLTIVAAVACLVALVARYRRSRGDEREQMKWFVYGGIAFIVLLPATTVLAEGRPILEVLAFVAVPILPAAIGVAVMKYRLYDIELVINKTVVYGALAAFITGVYVAIVVGVGALLGSAGRPNVALSIVATAVVAVAFQPARHRVQRLANRLVYGTRATPYETLSEFSDRMAGASAAEDILPNLAAAMAEGTGAARADVWLRSGDELRPAAMWPPGVGPRDPIRLRDGSVPTAEGPERIAPVSHEGELLGALSVTKKRGENLSPSEDRLIVDLATQAALVLRNAALTEELVARLDELAASRLRLVAARDEERRRLERTIQEGPERRLADLADNVVRTASRLPDGDRAADAIAGLRDDAVRALDQLRDVARGIYPPLLADKGLAAALEAQARKAPIPVAVDVAGLDRYPQEVEAAVYFVALEAMQNVASHARARRAWLRVADEGSTLRFEIRDDGDGFDPAETPFGAGLTTVSDRLAALDGSVAVESTPGSGVSVRGWIPLVATAAVV